MWEVGSPRFHLPSIIREHLRSRARLVEQKSVSRRGAHRRMVRRQRA
jgi:hypothetical protein